MTMKLSVITITVRSNPRLLEMARTLHASWLRSNIDLEWLVVDEVDPERAATITLGKVCTDEGMKRSENFKVEGIDPPASPHRGHRDPSRDGVAHNSYRNAGLARATGSYIVLLNDCNVVTVDWCNVVRDLALTERGFKCKSEARVDLPVPDDGVFKYKDHHDTFHEVPPKSAAGACWGAPRSAFEAIGGFDVAYDGQRRGNDIDAAIRLSRAGVKFYTTERAYAVQLERTKLRSEITTRPEVYAGKRNLELINDLVRDRTRILPRDGRRPTVIQAMRDLARGPARTFGSASEIDTFNASIAGKGALQLTPAQLVKDETYKTITANHPNDLNELVEGRATLVDQPDGTAAVVVPKPAPPVFDSSDVTVGAGDLDEDLGY